MGVRKYLIGYPPCDVHANLKDMTTCFHRDGIITYFLVLVTAVITIIRLAIKHLIIKQKHNPLLPISLITGSRLIS